MATPPSPPGTPLQHWRWHGRDADGQLRHGQCTGQHAAEVQAQLRQQGIWVTQVHATAATTRQRLPTPALAVLTRQLATLLRAGIPLLQALELTGRSQRRSAHTALLHALRHAIETGHAFSHALRLFPRDFPALYVHLVEAGEASGTLDAMLERLATYLEKSQALRRQLRTALTYPSAVLLVSLAVVAVMLGYIVPAFEDVFASMGAELPWITQGVMGLSDGLRQYGALLLAGCGALALTLLHGWQRAGPMRHSLERAALRLPLLGSLWRRTCVARWARTLATLQAAGIPMLDALHPVAGATGHHLYHRHTLQVRHAIATGHSLSQALHASGIFPPLLCHMVAIGEESGTLELMLSKSADAYEDEVEAAVQRLSSLLEPVLIVTLGAIIGTIVVAMYLPIFSLGSLV